MSKVSQFIIIFVFNLLLACMSLTASETHHITLDEFNKRLDTVLAIQGIEKVDQGEFIQYSHRPSNKIWFFSKEISSLHPSIVERTILEKNGDVSIRTEGWTGADPDEFVQLLKAFEAQDRQMSEQFAK